jgi:hypothetical protein
MRTAIYVYNPDPDFKIEFTLNSDVVITKFEGPNAESTVRNDNGKCVLTTGIYKVVSTDPPLVKASPGNLVDYEVVVVARDSDPWPDPPAQFRAVFADVSLAILRGFLQMPEPVDRIANDQTPVV